MLEGLKGTFEVAQEPFFSGMEEIWYSRMGRHCSEYGNEHHTLDTDAEELNVNKRSFELGIRQPCIHAGFHEASR